ncbi:MAG: NHL repeat-containing protein [Planctomycetota bacterium]
MPFGAARADTAPLEARLLEADPRGVKLSKGSSGGVAVGQIFDLYKEAEVYMLPLSNGEQPLVIPQRRVAQVQVFQTEPSTAAARVLSIEPNEKLVAKELRALLNPTAVAPNRRPELLDSGKRDAVAWGAAQTIDLRVSNEPDDLVVYDWEVTGGRLRYARTVVPSNVWNAPPEAGEYKLNVLARDSGGNEARTALTLRSSGVGQEIYARYVPSGRRFDGACRYGLTGDVTFGARGEVLTLTPKQGWGSTTSVKVEVPWRYPEVFARTIEDRYVGALALLGPADGDYGAVFALDTDNDVVLRYDLNSGWGTFSRPPLVIGSGGAVGNARFKDAVDLCLSRAGDLYVLDAGQRCVQAFEVSRGKTARAQFVVSFGSPGEERFELKQPVALAVGRDDVVHVLDAGRKTVVMYRDFRPFNEISVGDPEEVLSGLAVDPFSQDVCVLSRSKSRVRRYSRSGQLLGEMGAAESGLPSGLESPTRIRISPAREVWVLDRDGKAVVRYDEKGGFVGRSGGVELGSPLRVAGGADGFATLGNYQVTRFDRDGWVRARFGGEGTKTGEFENPIDLALTVAGDAFVLDAGQRRVHRFSPQGRPLGSLAKGLENVVDLSAVNDKTYVAALQQLEKGNFALLNQEPRIVRTFGRDFVDSLTPRFGAVTGITGRLSGGGKESARPVYWTADDDREHLYRTTGSGKPEAVELEFDAISDVEAGPNGQVYVADPGDDQIVVIGPGGKVLGQLKGAFCEGPYDLGVDDFGALFVYDKSTKQVVELVPAGK